MRRRFAEVVRSEPVDLGLACLLVGAEVDRGLDVDASLAVLDGLAAAARPAVPRVGVLAQARGLASVLGGFAGGDFEDVRSSLLHSVLERRTGLPLLLTVVWMEVAARLDVPVYAAALPGQVVVGIGDPEDEHVLVDAVRGRGAASTAADVTARRRRPAALLSTAPTCCCGCSPTSARSPPGRRRPSTSPARGCGPSSCRCCCRGTRSSCGASGASCWCGWGRTWRGRRSWRSSRWRSPRPTRRPRRPRGARRGWRGRS